MAFEGMDAEAIKQLAGRLQTQGHQIDAIRSTIGQLVEKAESSWRGDAATRFAAQWRSTYGPELARAAGDVNGLATTARRNATEQDKASNNVGSAVGTFIGSGSASTHHGGFFSGLASGFESGLKSAFHFQVGWDKDVLSGAFDSVVGIGKLGWDISPIREVIDPAGYTKSIDDLGKGLETAVTHPATFGKALIDWKDLTDGHPGRAVGELLPTIALTVFSGGAGAAAKGADAAATLDRTGAAVEALQKTGSVFPELSESETAAKVAAAGIDPDSAAGAAAKFQVGQPYGGIDPWVNGKLNPGDLVAMGRGGKLSGFAIDPAVGQAANPSDIWRMLQVAPRRIPTDGLPYSAGAPGDRAGLDIFRYDGPNPIDKAEAPSTMENPQFGPGGLPQQFIPHAQQLLDNGQLTKVDEILTPGGRIRIEDPAFARVNPDLPSNPLTVHGAQVTGGLQGGAAGAGVGLGSRAARDEN